MTDSCSDHHVRLLEHSPQGFPIAHQTSEYFPSAEWLPIEAAVDAIPGTAVARRCGNWEADQCRLGPTGDTVKWSVAERHQALEPRWSLCNTTDKADSRDPPRSSIACYRFELRASSSCHPDGWTNFVTIVIVRKSWTLCPISRASRKIMDFALLAKKVHGHCLTDGIRWHRREALGRVLPRIGYFDFKGCFTDKWH